MPSSRVSPHTDLRTMTLPIMVLSVLLAAASTANAVTMVNDPKGFQNIPWGTSLANQQNLTLARAGPHINEYQLKNGPSHFAETEMDSMVFSTVNGQFARVTIRYRGEHTHGRIMTYLERTFGVQERAPGQTMRGLKQQFNWHGTDTEINLTYDAYGERGFIFFNSRTLAPRFNDFMADSAD